MKTIVIFVTTLDGKITKWGDPHVQRWSSKEDQEYFKKVWNESPLTVIGSSTFDFDPIKPSLSSLLVVLTKNPEKYKKYELAKHLEFSSETPTQLAERFEKAGYDQMLVVGGPHVATSFFAANLVDELWLTLEPKIFGKGGNFVIEEELDIELELLSIEKINERGTLIAKYKVMKK
jgi:dihydrofolate reductase